MINYLLLFTASVCTLLGQILLKKGAQASSTNLSVFVGKFSILGYLSFLASIIFNVLALRWVPLSILIVFQGATNLLTVMLSNKIFNEQFSIKQFIGLGILVFGLIVFFL